MSKYHAYYYRGFLNSDEHGGIALVEATVHNRSFGLNGQITLGDCQRQITLDFSAHTEEGLELMRQKLGKLKAVVAAVEATLESQVPAQRLQWAEEKKTLDVPKGGAVEFIGNRMPSENAVSAAPMIRRRRPRRA